MVKRKYDFDSDHRIVLNRFRVIKKRKNKHLNIQTLIQFLLGFNAMVDVGDELKLINESVNRNI